MTDLQKIERSVAELSPEDLERFGQWFDKLRADLWDKQIEDDERAGRLDKLIADAKAEIAAGKVRLL